MRIPFAAVAVAALAAATAVVTAASCRSDGNKSTASARSAPDVAERAPPVDRSDTATAPVERAEPAPRPEPAERASGGGGHGW